MMSADQKNNQQLANVIRELVHVSKTASDKFNDLVRVRDLTATMVSDPAKFGSDYEYYTYTGQFFGNIIKPFFVTELTVEAHQKLFSGLTTLNAYGCLAAVSLGRIVENFDHKNFTEEELVEVFRKVSSTFLFVGNDYLNAYDECKGMELVFNSLPESQQLAIDSMAKKNLELNLTAELLSYPRSHFLKVPLLLKELVKCAKASQNKAIHELAEPLDSVNKKITAHLKEINESMPKPEGK